VNKGFWGLKGNIFEKGGKKKNKKKKKKIKKSYLVLDNIEIAEKKKIPLFLFGFFY